MAQQESDGKDQTITVGNLTKNIIVPMDTGTSVVEATQLMKACRVGSVLVLQKGRLLGIVTESDVVRQCIGADRVPYDVPVEDIMRSPIVGIEAQRPIAEAPALMDTHRTRHPARLTAMLTPWEPAYPCVEECRSRRSALELVADAAHGYDQAPFRMIALEFLAEGMDMHVERMFLECIAFPPHPVQHVLA